MASVDKMVGKKYFVYYSVNADTELYTPNQPRSTWSLQL